MKIVRRLSSIVRGLRKDAVRYEDVTLPAPHLRFCTEAWRSNHFYVRSAEHEVDRLVELGGLSSEKSLLDIGSGQGRLAIGLQRRMPGIRAYVGIDVHAQSVDWCKRHIEQRSPNLRFVRIDAANARYNATGKRIDETFRLPFAAESFDVAFLYSVFTHMATDDVALYLREITRVLRAGGRMLATAYIEDDVPPCEENTPDYLSDVFGPPARPLHWVRFERGHFVRLVENAGMRVDQIAHHSEPLKQSLLVAERPTT